MSNHMKAYEQRLAERSRVIAEKEEVLLALFNKYPNLSIEITFSCGGDSMNDLYLEEDKLPKEMSEEEITVLAGIVEDIVYDKVNFYVNSDGHYCGEAGIVQVEKEEDILEWHKIAEAEYSEVMCITPKIDLEKEGFTQKEIDYLKDVVAGVLHTDGGEDFIFKRDLVLFEEDRNIIDRFSSMLTRSFKEDVFYDEAYEEAIKQHDTFDTSDESVLCSNEGNSVDQRDELEIEGKILTLYYEIRGYVFVPSDE